MNPRNGRSRTSPVVVLLAPAALALAAGCGSDSLLSSEDGTDASPAHPVGPPAGLATVALGADALTLWPYTGSSFDGTPVDPVNVIFAGHADPLQIRAALLALDGDRTALGIPPVPPFDARWSDVLGGGVQTAYSDGPLGWSGSVVQLTLGDFGPLRVHLRLFRTGVPCGDSGTWTVGGAHFELQIPGTADHQVLSWDVARQIVVADLMRTGLLDGSVPVVPTGAITATPSFRTIPAIIYNGLPDAVIALIDGPPKPVATDVPITNNGSAMILNVATAAPVERGHWSRSTTVLYDQVVPKPFCSTGPGDYLWVNGPVDFVTDVDVNARGHYTVHSSYVGHLQAVPVDVSSGVPVPIGESRTVRVDGRQEGLLTDSTGRIASRDRRMVHSGDGPELWTSRLVIPESGQPTYRATEHCLDSGD